MPLIDELLRRAQAAKDIELPVDPGAKIVNPSTWGKSGIREDKTQKGHPNRHKNLKNFLHPRKDGKQHGS